MNHCETSIDVHTLGDCRTKLRRDQSTQWKPFGSYQSDEFKYRPLANGEFNV